MIINISVKMQISMFIIMNTMMMIRTWGYINIQTSEGPHPAARALLARCSVHRWATRWQEAWLTRDTEVNSVEVKKTGYVSLNAKTARG